MGPGVAPHARACFVSAVPVRGGAVRAPARCARPRVVCVAGRTFAEALAARAAAAAEAVGGAGGKLVRAGDGAQEGVQEGVLHAVEAARAEREDVDRDPPKGLMLGDVLEEMHGGVVERSAGILERAAAVRKRVQEKVRSKMGKGKGKEKAEPNGMGFLADVPRGGVEEVYVSEDDDEDGYDDGLFTGATWNIEGDRKAAAHPAPREEFGFVGKTAPVSGIPVSMGATGSKDGSVLVDVDDMNLAPVQTERDLREKDRRSKLRELRTLAARGASNVVSEALTTALRSVKLGSEEDAVDPIVPPEEPRFDPITALVLAGYAFQAYLEPPRGAYWESHAAEVKGSSESMRILQTITTRVAYPNVEGISKTARGVFMLQVEPIERPDGMRRDNFRPLETKFFVTASLNNAGFQSDVFRDGFHTFSLLKASTNDLIGKEVPEDMEDNLVLNVYESKKAFDEGAVVLGTKTVPLAFLVEESKRKMGGTPGERQYVKFKAVTDEEANDDFFEFNLLPEGFQLPFGTAMSSKDTRQKYADEVPGSSVAVVASYIPFDMQGGDEDEEDEDDFADLEEEEESNALRQVEALTISKTMAKGDMPLDWNRLAKELTSLLGEVDASDLGRTENSIHEDLGKAMYIASPETDSEVWLWHDTANKHVVISFRGTEQTKWKDFVTDSLVFLQAWKPGDDIVLDIESGKTMGLDLWDVVMNGSKKGQEDDVSAMPCVHWGFLRAYLSLQDSIDSALNKLTNGFEEDYQYFFTGHSLGGALASVAACDLQARRGGPDANMNICMMNFGSPRVGNRAYAVEFNRLVPHAFRIVNGADLVARMPQTPSRLRGGFRHVGRTCLVDEDGEVWVQGEHGDDRDGSAFPTQKAENLKDLLVREKEMWKLLISGQSLGHHMEDSYFTSLRTTVRKFLTR